jgi:leucyl aminopeptidase
MELHFLPPDLRRLDETPSEVLISSIFEDSLPPQGTTGLINWRMAGRIDRLILSGFLTGERGEVLMLPGKPQLTAEKIILFGLGSYDRFEEEVFDETIHQILTTLVNLCTRSAILELPGRQLDALSAEQAADRFLTVAANFDRSFDAFSIIERPEDQKRVNQHMIEERRRIRRW